MKKFKLALVLGILLGTLVLSAQLAVADEFTIIVNGKEVKSDVPAQTINNRTMVPISFIANALDMQVKWVQSAQAVVVTSKASTEAEFTPPAPTGSEIQVFVDAKKVQGDVPAQLVNNRTMVPVAFVADALGMKVQWDAGTKTVLIDNKPVPETNPEIIPNGDLTSANPVECKNTEWLRINKWINGSFQINKKTYDKGIGFVMDDGHGPLAYLVYNINGYYFSFTGSFGTDDMDSDGNNNRLIIYGDGKELYKSPIMKEGATPVNFNVNVYGVKQLKIIFDTTYGKYPVLLNPILN
ncbi:MAG: stalk domain-containing protein [Syntrophomonadaceae bacterium]